jgi:hypothetical protein
MVRAWTLLIVLLAPPLGAHHSAAAEFNVTKPVALTGVVIRIEWVNPHAWLFMHVRDAQGSVVPWMVELPSVFSLKRAGLTRESFPLDGEVTAEVWLAKDGTQRAGVRGGGTIMLAGGKKVTLPNLVFNASGTKLLYTPTPEKK